MLTIPQIIQIARVSQYLSSEKIANGALFNNGELDTNLPFLLYRVRKSVEWAYNLSPTYATLQQVANYLYGLCGAYALTAQYIINTGGGSITPVVPSEGYAYVSLPYTVTVDNTTSFQTNDLIGGNNLAFIVYNDQLLTLAKNEFSVNYITGTITFTTITLFIGDTLTASFNKKL